MRLRLGRSGALTMPRIRWGIGLPGPFVLTGSGRRRRRSGTGLGWALFALLVLVGACFAWPVFGWTVLGLVVAGLAVLVVKAVR